jgi:hypothetical protein
MKVEKFSGNYVCRNFISLYKLYDKGDNLRDGGGTTGPEFKDFAI